MAASTLDLDVIDKKAGSVYEAVLIMSKRARAITAERKSREVLDESYITTEVDGIDPMPEEVRPSESANLAKPIAVAMDDFFDNKLQVFYRKEETEEDS
jgi:DNA-directed RNA polymerase subunit K/omega